MQAWLRIYNDSQPGQLPHRHQLTGADLDLFLGIAARLLLGWRMEWDSQGRLVHSHLGLDVGVGAAEARRRGIAGEAPMPCLRLPPGAAYVMDLVGTGAKPAPGLVGLGASRYFLGMLEGSRYFFHFVTLPEGHVAITCLEQFSVPKEEQERIMERLGAEPAPIDPGKGPRPEAKDEEGLDEVGRLFLG